MQKKKNRLAVEANIAIAKTLSAGFYTDPKLLEESKKKIFEPSWQFIGDTDMIGGNHTIHPFTLLENFLDEPLVITHGTDNSIKCLSNVCTHRGNIIATEHCKAAHLRCKYHGRTFNLEGKFNSMPEFKEVKNFPSATDHLASLPVFQWGKWLFTSLNKRSKPEKYFTDVMNRMSWLPLNDFKFRPDLSQDYMINAHWALYCENFLEGFHIPFVHAGLNEIIDFGSYSTELFSHANLQVGMAKDNEDCFDLPESAADFGKKIAAYYFWVFPNLMLNFYPWGLSINIVRPIGIDQTKISFITYVLDEKKLYRGAGNDLHTVEMEDEEVVQNVQRGVRSRFYSHGRYSVTREKGVHHFHRLIAETMK